MFASLIFRLPAPLRRALAYAKAFAFLEDPPPALPRRHPERLRPLAATATPGAPRPAPPTGAAALPARRAVAAATGHVPARRPRRSAVRASDDRRGRDRVATARLLRAATALAGRCGRRDVASGELTARRGRVGSAPASGDRGAPGGEAEPRAPTSDGRRPPAHHAGWRDRGRPRVNGDRAGPGWCDGWIAVSGGIATVSATARDSDRRGRRSVPAPLLWPSASRGDMAAARHVGVRWHPSEPDSTPHRRRHHAAPRAERSHTLAHAHRPRTRP